MCYNLNMIEEVIKSVLALSNITVSKETVCLVGILILGLIISKISDDKRFKKYYDDMKNEKNKEIERLADDNRRYREIYLSSLGMSKQQVDDMSAAKMKGD